MLSIVQPHNTFVWALVEGGIIGVILFCWPFWESLRGCLVKSARQRSKCSKRDGQDTLLWLALAAFVLTNSLDSQLIIAPNVALISWFLLLSFPELLEATRTGGVG